LVAVGQTTSRRTESATDKSACTDAAACNRTDNRTGASTETGTAGQTVTFRVTTGRKGNNKSAHRYCFAYVFHWKLLKLVNRTSVST
jgi:hypothetical protein